MAVVAFGVALDSVNSASTAVARVAFAGWSPSRPPSYPTNLGLAHGTLEPVTAPFLH